MGETIARLHFKKTGWYVLPASLIENGGAPLLESTSENVILPDILAFKNGGGQCAIDVKSKSRATFYQKLNRSQTGIELRHFEHYKRFQQVTGLRTALAFIFADRKELHLGFIDEIESDAQRFMWSADWAASHPGHAYTESLINFNCDPNHGSRFKVFGRLEEIPGWQQFQGAAIPPKTVRPWEQKTKDLRGQKRFEW